MTSSHGGARAEDVPVHDAPYRVALDCIRSHLTSLVNLQLVGRNDQHCYNNQNHSMMTALGAMLDAQPSVHGTAPHEQAITLRAKSCYAFASGGSLPSTALRHLSARKINSPVDVMQANQGRC